MNKSKGVTERKKGLFSVQEIYHFWSSVGCKRGVYFYTYTAVLEKTIDTKVLSHYVGLFFNNIISMTITTEQKRILRLST